ncbi:hypothetical protein BGP78_18405 [Pseudoalteromonas sp. MSK9-3]|uniref:sensor domain-containing diguanylate cyclase n=1 Tax=Pseudoalteromonas sp. MSK9-3 TaxID=1897633 RepID=UPI000E6C2591|nr:sensor domain-containing diguanylate cyclase [Pseudoalteromonas sp. MSK9-3]RJE73591.1 hypothetical protein BGP78_18405 [Pseudoalteromonas sp. MSK9-3]
MLGCFNSTKQIDLKRLIFLLAFFSMVITLGNSLHATFRVQKALLIEDTLEANRVYATKLAEITELFLNSVVTQLSFSANYIGTDFDSTVAHNNELQRLIKQTSSFNSAVIVNAAGEVLSTAPSSLNLTGFVVESAQARAPLLRKEPYISTPFISPAGNLIISVSHPIFNDVGKYQGFIAASIYLQGDNILNRLLGKHHYSDGSYLYVVDQNKQLIYHVDAERVGTTIQSNEAIEDVISGKSGVRVLRNSQGTDMLSGYASVPISGWGVVAQRPLTVTLAQLNDTILSVLKSTLPVTILTLLLILVFGSKIAKPLWKLAIGVRAMDRYAQSNVQKIDAWYFEAEHLKQAIVSGTELVGKTIQEYDLDRQKDPLTQLLNRRGMLAKLEYFQSIKKPYSVIALDIDHFKRINDKFGHDVGDQVIRTLAELMQSSAREQDVICRTGGEEFAIFLPNVDIGQAVSIAERLRVDVSNHLFPPVAKVNISLGVAYSSRTECNFHQVLKNADKALYDAKRGGRNRTAVTDCEAA